MRIHWFSDSCASNAEHDYDIPTDCKQITSSLRDYAVKHDMLTIDDVIHVCYVNGKEWYYKGKPTCVAANDDSPWGICDSDK